MDEQHNPCETDALTDHGSRQHRDHPVDNGGLVETKETVCACTHQIQVRHYASYHRSNDCDDPSHDKHEHRLARRGVPLKHNGKQTTNPDEADTEELDKNTTHVEERLEAARDIPAIELVMDHGHEAL